MIIPTAEFDPLFAEDGVPFRHKMLDYIEREFSDILATAAATRETAAVQQLRRHSEEAQPSVPKAA